MLPGDGGRAERVHAAWGSREDRKDQEVRKDLLLTWQEDFLLHVLNQATVRDHCAFHSSLMVADCQSSEDGNISR